MAIDPNVILSRLNDGTLARGRWTGTDALGRHIACLLAAIVPECGEKKSPSACPAEVMPAWLAYLTPKLDDCTSSGRWPGHVRRYATVAGRWHMLDGNAWRRCLLATLDEYLAISEPYDTHGVVAPVRALIADGAPVGDGRWRAETASAWAAMEAAEMEARGVAGVRAEEAEDAARAAAWAAFGAEDIPRPETAKAAEEAAKAAARGRWAAWDRIADACLAAIERECDAAAATPLH